MTRPNPTLERMVAAMEVEFLRCVRSRSYTTRSRMLSGHPDGMRKLAIAALTAARDTTGDSERVRDLLQAGWRVDWAISSVEGQAEAVWHALLDHILGGKS